LTFPNRGINLRKTMPLASGQALRVGAIGAPVFFAFYPGLLVTRWARLNPQHKETDQ
jgi:hypothetical protein